MTHLTTQNIVDIAANGVPHREVHCLECRSIEDPQYQCLSCCGISLTLTNIINCLLKVRGFDGPEHMIERIYDDGGFDDFYVNCPSCSVDDSGRTPCHTCKQRGGGQLRFNDVVGSLIKNNMSCQK